MKLAEALLQRATLKTQTDRLLERVKANALVQEGDVPAEDPAALLKEYETSMKALKELIVRINKTNSVTAFDGRVTIADAIAKRDDLTARIGAYRAVAERLQIIPDRYTKTEIRFVRTLQPADIQKTIDVLSKEYRELDTKLQGLNWNVDLLE